MDVLNRFRGDSGTCACHVSFEESTDVRHREEPTLTLDASDCPGGGDLVASPACRATVVDALAVRDAGAVHTVASGTERAYERDAAALLLSAGRFVERAAFHDEALATRARLDPLAAAREATGRAGPVARIAAETGLAEGAARADDYAEALRVFVGPTVSESRIDSRPPADAELLDRRELDTGATVRRYRVDDVRHYHLEPVEQTLDDEGRATLASAYKLLARGAVSGGERAPGRAIRRVADDDTPVETLSAILRKHTRGHGVLADLFADPRLSDVYATAPVDANPLRATVDGERLTTNIRLTVAGAAALASRLRRTSGRAFSRANPTVDATVEASGQRIRVAGVTAPASDGPGFAFRRHEREPWTLPALVENDTVAPGVAALLSLSAERGAATLIAGPRGAGKTTMLGALLWELPHTVRTVVVEDTPELPTASLQAAGRDVQSLRTDPGDGPAPTPAEALRTALRLGEGALVVGEVRGEEARVLYEAMRVGAGDAAVFGTIHGSGGTAVRERVVNDLGVPESAFGATDLVVTLGADPHRVTRVEEVRTAPDGVVFETLSAPDDGAVASPGTQRGPSESNMVDPLDAGPVARGNSRFVAELAAAGETYAAVREALEDRAERLRAAAATGQTAPDEISTRSPARDAAVVRSNTGGADG